MSVHGAQPIAVVDEYIDETSDTSFWMPPNILVTIRLKHDEEGTQRGEPVILMDDETVQGADLHRPIVDQGL